MNTKERRSNAGIIATIVAGGLAAIVSGGCGYQEYMTENPGVVKRVYNDGRTENIRVYDTRLPPADFGGTFSALGAAGSVNPRNVNDARAAAALGAMGDAMSREEAARTGRTQVNVNIGGQTTPGQGTTTPVKQSLINLAGRRGVLLYFINDTNGNGVLDVEKGEVLLTETFYKGDVIGVLKKIPAHSSSQCAIRDKETNTLVFRLGKKTNLYDGVYVDSEGFGAPSDLRGVRGYAIELYVNDSDKPESSQDFFINHDITRP